MRALLAAMQFLTRLPLAGFAPTARDRARSLYWYGFVGLGIGSLLAGAEFLLRPAVPSAPRLVCVLILNAVLTGALHLDGTADTMDGLGGGNGARSLAIMRDSRIGTYGVLGLVGILALQYGALCSLPPAAVSHALLLAPGWGRASMVLSAAVSRSAREDGLGAAFIASAQRAPALTSVAFPTAAALLLHDRAGALAGVVAIGAAPALAAYFRRRFGGQTGDTLGCVNEVVETATYGLFMVMH